MLDLLRTPTALAVADIRTDGGTQPRAGIDNSVVDDYADAMIDGAEFPSIIVYHDGAAYWLADGFHRLAAWKIANPGRPIPADVRQGDRREAVLHSVGANADHGLRRTNEDKRRAVMRLLGDGEWGQWSDREIARRCHVSHNFVSTLRRSLSSDDSDSTERTYTTRHGTVATMQTRNIGESRPAPAQRNPSPTPVPPLSPADKPALPLLDAYGKQPVLHEATRLSIKIAEWATGNNHNVDYLRAAIRPQTSERTTIAAAVGPASEYVLTMAISEAVTRVLTARISHTHSEPLRMEQPVAPPDTRHSTPDTPSRLTPATLAAQARPQQIRNVVEALDEALALLRQVQPDAEALGLSSIGIIISLAERCRDAAESAVAE